MDSDSTFDLDAIDGLKRRGRLAAKWLLSHDAALARQYRRGQTAGRKWQFDSRVGREWNHDQLLTRVLPLLLPMRVQDRLYPFQRTGVAWLLRHRRAILADDMGLGKTIQVIAALRRLYRFGQIESCMVVAPRTLVSNWMTELESWAPELTIARLDSAAETPETINWRSRVARVHVILASYEELRTNWRAIAEYPPDMTVADEGHRLRKSESQTHQAMQRIRSRWLWVLSGTPIERDAADLACLLALLEPLRFAVDDDRLGLTALRARARPYFLRRTKADVLPEIPAAREFTHEVELEPIQRAAYNAARKRYVHDAESRLRLFNELRRICDLDEESGVSAKLDRATELIREAADVNKKSVVFSYTLSPLEAMSERLQTAGLGAALLVGEQSLEERDRAVSRFKNDVACSTLLASMRVGSEGLTLTEATVVAFINRWWNPSANSQAVDRVVRIGQTKPVDVHYLVARDTVDDHLGPLLERKRLTYDQLVDALRSNPRMVEDLLGI